ncbi:MAG TPA: thioredoxin domain-containing protein [Gemmatimonadaceae bacterium]|nr:thioredoxin domain-containing protein [Gemmatimonadaceae bacterium]
MQRKEIILNVVTLVTGACAVAVAVHSFRTQSLSSRPGPESKSVSGREERRLLTSGHRIGPPDAKLSIIEFGDFQCPVCRAYEHVLDTMRTRYPTDFAVVFHQLPLTYHKFAYRLARMSECAANQDRFTEMHDFLFREQVAVSATAIRRAAERAAVPNVDDFVRCASDTTRVAVIDADKADATRLGLPGTPTVIVNGSIHTADLDVRALEKLLQEGGRD